MNDDLLKATMELVEASYERDFLDLNGGSRFEPRVFAAVEKVLGLLAGNADPAVQRWARELRARRDQEEFRAKVGEEAS